MVERAAIVAGEQKFMREAEMWQSKVKEVPIRVFASEKFTEERKWMITSDE